MSNAVYQATVEALEAVLSPRVVSRSLQEGLRQVERTPEDVRYEDLDKILKTQIYRQLQVSMPVTQAKDAIKDLLGQLKKLDATADAEGDGSTTSTLERQTETLAELRTALKPYNLYFEWPEVQKLRAQLQVIEEEQEAKRDTSALLAEARAQLQDIGQKLEDQLVLQSRQLGELAAALEQVRTLGGPKVRRLESLINQIQSAQKDRQLAPAEVERARKLGTDLRKLMESSVFAEAGNTPDAGPGEGVLELESETDVEGLLTIDSAEPDPDLSARLLLIDLESERQDLDTLAQDHAHLLAFRDDLQERLDALRARLGEESSVAEELEALRAELEPAQQALREELRQELEAIRADVEALRPEVDASALRQAATVAIGILSTTLPNPSDVEHVRSLHRLALERNEEFGRRESEQRSHAQAKLGEQEAVLERLQSTLVAFEDTYADRALAREEHEALRRSVDALRDAHADGTLAPELVADARQAQERLEAAVARGAEDDRERQAASVRALQAQLQALPALAETRERVEAVEAELTALLARLDAGALSQEELEAARSLAQDLPARVQEAARRRLSGLASAAGELNARELLGRVQEAVSALDEGTFPDLEELDVERRVAEDRRRQEQLDELHQLERELEPYRKLSSASLDELRTLLAEARERVLQGKTAPDLDRAWNLLEELRNEADAALQGFEPRLDAALAAFERVEKLNSDDVTALRRILAHLDSQRASFDRISVGLRSQLETSLAEAEALLGRLEEEFEATRAIADQLVSSNVLDDVLGIFGGAAAPDPGVAPAAPVPAPAAGVEAHSEDAGLERLIASYLAEGGVAGAALFGGDGALLCGRLPAAVDGLPAALAAAERDLTGLGEELQLGAARIATFERNAHTLLVAWPSPGLRMLLLLDGPSALSLVQHRLRRDLQTLSEPHGGAALS